MIGLFGVDDSEGGGNDDKGSKWALSSLFSIEDCPISTLGLFAIGVAKLITLNVSSSNPFDWKTSPSLLKLAA